MATRTPSSARTAPPSLRSEARALERCSSSRHSGADSGRWRSNARWGGPAPSAARDRRQHLHLGAVADLGAQPTLEADVVPVDVDVHEAAHLTGLVADPPGEQRVLRGERV